MRNIVILSCFVFIFSPFVLFCGGTFDAVIYQGQNDQRLRYRIYLPDEITENNPLIPGLGYPLLLFFHGGGQRGHDNFIQLFGGPVKILNITQKLDKPTIIIVPQCPLGEQWVNTPKNRPFHSMDNKPAQSMELTMEMLKEIIEVYPVDKQRIYTAGFSMGGFAVWDIIQRMPDLFAAAIPVCGGGDEDLTSLIKTVSIWAFHGENDTIVLPERSRNMIKALIAAGGSPLYTEYKNTGHNSWTRTFSNEEIITWLLAQSK